MKFLLNIDRFPIGKLHHEGDALKHRKHHAWFSVINRNKIKSSGSGNVFNQAIAQHKNKIGNVDLDGENDIDSDSEHQRQLRSVISAAALTSAQIGKILYLFISETIHENLR